MCLFGLSPKRQIKKVKKPKRVNTHLIHFMAVKKVEKTFWFCSSLKMWDLGAGPLPV